ncbi:MAG: hypothetical protein UY09_C0009G0009 [Parcubacteria group bacterium GW2011_GWA2_47_8]|nr:MAG: hypothetical protein UY09_C0009G0009 [Parcubacteria group bacterium GW2011_GWA2_47_8]
MQCRNTQQYTRQKGALAEQYAATFLYRRGYTILHRNWRVRMGEIDIIARNGRFSCQARRMVIRLSNRCYCRIDRSTT